MRRDTLLELLWAHSPLFIGREQFAKALEDWEIHELHGPNGLAVLFVVKGPEFHFAKLDADYQVTRDDLRRWPGDLIAKYGYAETRTPKHDTRQRRFNERLGFRRVGEDEHEIHYRIDKLRV